MLCGHRCTAAQYAFSAQVGVDEGSVGMTKMVPEVPRARTRGRRDDPGTDGGTGIVAAAGDHGNAGGQVGDGRRVVAGIQPVTSGPSSISGRPGSGTRVPREPRGE